jgi:hypothetical protein
VRLFRTVELTCRDLDIDAPPASVFPPRSFAGFGNPAAFHNISSGDGYTLVAWAVGDDGTTPLAVGCLDLRADQVRAGRPHRLQLSVADRPATLPAAFELTSSFDLHLLADALDGLDATIAWQKLACPAGPGQLLLDCALDAVADDGALDCVVGGSDPLVTAIETGRGASLEDGCRPTEVDGEPSLDQLVTDAVAAGGGFPTGDDLDALLAARDDALAGVELTSTLAFVSGSAASHRLSTLRFDIGGTPHEIALGDTARPVLEQSQVPITLYQGRVSVGAHGFTLRIGSAAGAAFRDVGLAAAGLADRAGDLGAALAGSASDPDSGSAGCAAVSAVACAAVGEAQGCLETACGAATPALDRLFTDWIRLADGTHLDLELSGSAPVYDFEDDLTIDTIGREDGGQATGSWAGTLFLSDDSAVELVGQFGSEAPSPSRRSATGKAGAGASVR